MPQDRHLRVLGRRLERDGWSVFEAGGADLMAGQQYFGQLEGRIQKTVEELNVGKRLIWYIPDILQIAMSGTHQGQAASVLDQILPAIAAGRLIVWTEASPAVTARLLRLRPTLRNIFEIARMEPLEAAETLVLGEYGDQGLLIGRDFYLSLGGFRALPLMEDVDLVRRIGRRRLVILPISARTSAARWRSQGWTARSLRNVTCLSLYFLGVPPRLLYRLYG